MTEGLIGLLGVMVGVVLTAWYQERTAKNDREHKIRLAALDRRLETHQEAYRLIKKLKEALEGMSWGIKPAADSASKTWGECMRFWDGNCLYLDRRSRKEISEIVRSLNWLTMWGIKGHETLPMSEDEINARYDSVLQVIAEEVGLPPINEPKPDRPSNATQ